MTNMDCQLTSGKKGESVIEWNNKDNANLT